MLYYIQCKDYLFIDDTIVAYVYLYISKVKHTG